MNAGQKRVTQKVCEDWLRELFTYMQQQEGCENIFNEPDRIFNCDETGFALDGAAGRTIKVVATRGRRQVNRIKQGTKESITTMCTAAATGKLLPPYIVITGIGDKDHKPRKGVIEEHHLPDSKYYCTPNGWMTHDAFAYYMTCFNNWITERGVKKPVLLLCDGATQHSCQEAGEIAFKNNIHVFVLPANATDKLQPLDVGFMAPVKDAWKKTLMSYQYENIGKPDQFITRKIFPKLLNAALKKTLKSDGIRNAFRKVGIFPMNPRAPYEPGLRERFTTTEDDPILQELQEALHVDEPEPAKTKNVKMVPVEQYKILDTAAMENAVGHKLAHTYQTFVYEDGTKIRSEKVTSLTTAITLKVKKKKMKKCQKKFLLPKM